MDNAVLSRMGMIGNTPPFCTKTLRLLLIGSERVVNLLICDRYLDKVRFCFFDNTTSPLSTFKTALHIAFIQASGE